jgi:hypothetical protein
LKEGQWVSFSQLEKLGLGPQNLLNYRQAQSENWRRVCNIATIDEAAGNIIGHRAEFNLFNSGLQHQRSTAVLLAALIAFNDTFYESTKALLRVFGIDLEDLSASRETLERNFQSLCFHGNRFHDLIFGNKTLKDFALPFADLIESAYDGTAFSSPTSPALHILRSGRPDWMVYRKALPTIESLKAYLAAFPALVEECPELLSGISCADHIMPALQRFIAA